MTDRKGRIADVRGRCRERRKPVGPVIAGSDNNNPQRAVQLPAVRPSVKTDLDVESNLGSQNLGASLLNGRASVADGGSPKSMRYSPAKRPSWVNPR